MSGPSGAGKTALIQRLTDSDPSVVRALTATTRPPSQDERNGVDYLFVSARKFKSWIDRGEMLEHVRYVGEYYGTPVSSVLEPLKQGKSVVLVIDVQGAMKVKKLLPAVTTVFIAPPGMAELRRRLEERRRDHSEQIESRLTRAREEMEYKDRYEHVILNDVLEKAVEELRTIVSGKS